MDLMAPPTQDELMAAPTEAELGSMDLMAPPTEKELMAAPTPQELASTPGDQDQAIGSGSPQGWWEEFKARPNTTSVPVSKQEIIAIASKYKVNPDLLLNRVPTYGGHVEGHDGVVPTIKEVLGTVSEGPLLGIPTAIERKLSSANEASALDELNQLVESKKSKAELAAEMLLPVGGTIKAGGAGIKAMAKSGAMTGAVAGFGESKEGEEISNTLVGAGLGGAIGAGAHAGVSAIKTGASYLFGKKAATALAKEASPSAPIQDILEKVYTPELAALNKNAATKLYRGEDIDIPEESLIDFARSIQVVSEEGTKSTNLAKAREIIDDARLKLGPDDFESRYHDWAKVKAAETELGALIGPESTFAKEAARSTRFFWDGMSVANDIDRRNGGSVVEAMLEAGRADAQATADRVDWTKKAKNILAHDDADEVINKAIAQGTKLEGELGARQAEIRSFYEDIRKHLNDLGVPVAERENFLPTKTVDTPEAIYRIRKKVMESGGWQALMEKMPGELKQAMSYYTGSSADGKEGVDILRKLTTPGSAAYARERLSSSLFEYSEGAIPEFLREYRTRPLLNRYLSENLNYAHMRESLAKLKLNKELLTKAGAKEDAAFIDRAVQGYYGARGPLDAAAHNLMVRAQVAAYEAADKATNPAARRFYDNVAHSPEILSNLTKNIYTNVLSSPKAVLQNFAGLYFQTIPELGWAYGTKGLLGATAKALGNLASRPKEYLGEMTAKGFIGPEMSDIGHLITRKEPGILGKGLDTTASLASSPFKGIERLNRAVLYEVGKDLAANWEKPMAAKFAKSMPASYRNLVDKSAPSMRERLITMYIQDRGQASYNKLARSDAARYVGPMFSMFTKYPGVMAGRMGEAISDKGLAKGSADIVTKYVAPWLALQQMSVALKNTGSLDPETEEYFFGKGGLASVAPLPAAANVIGASSPRAPATQILGAAMGTGRNLALAGTKALAGEDYEANLDAAVKNLSGLTTILAPGGLNGYYNFLEDTMHLTGALDKDEHLGE